MFKLRKKVRVIKRGNRLLRQKSIEVPEISEHVTALTDIMLDTMYENNGLGLAAPQIGINLQITIIDIPKPEKQDASRFPFTGSPGELLLIHQMPVVFINPKIIASGEKTSVIEEGCLSIPKVFDTVQRPTTLVLNTQLLSGEEITVECGGMLARALQHEIDHLNGILFTDYFSKKQLKKHKKMLDEIEAEEKSVKKGINSNLAALAQKITPQLNL